MGREGERGKSLLACVESARSRRMTTEGRVSQARKDEWDLEVRRIQDGTLEVFRVPLVHDE